MESFMQGFLSWWKWISFTNSQNLWRKESVRIPWDLTDIISQVELSTSFMIKKKNIRNCKMPAGIFQAVSLPNCTVTDKSLTGFLQMCGLNRVAVIFFSLSFGCTEFCSVLCHPRDIRQQDFILLGMKRLSGTSWRRMRKGLSVLAWEVFTSHLNLPVNYIGPDKDVRVYSGSKPRKLVNLFCLHFFRKYAVNFISWRVNFQMVSDRWVLWCKGFPFSWLLHCWLLALMSVAWWM